MAEAPAEVPRPLNDLGALAERPLSTCTLNDQLERIRASRVGGGCPRPPPGCMAGCSVAAKDGHLVAPAEQTSGGSRGGGYRRVSPAGSVASRRGWRRRSGDCRGPASSHRGEEGCSSTPQPDRTGTTTQVKRHMGMDMGNTDGHTEAQLRAWTDERSRRASHKGAAPTCTHTEFDSRGGSRVRKGSVSSVARPVAAS